MTSPVSRASAGRVPIVIATIALSVLAIAVGLIGRLSGDHPAAVSMFLIGAAVVNIACAVVSITTRDIRRTFAWWLCSTLVLAGLLGYAALGETLSVWALLVFGTAIIATCVAVVRVRRTASAD